MTRPTGPEPLLPDDRRRERRLAQFPVVAWVRLPHRTEVSPVLDLSPHGFRLRLPASSVRAVGTHVSVRLVDGASGRAISVQARVVWASEASAGFSIEAPGADWLGLVASIENHLLSEVERAERSF